MVRVTQRLGIRSAVILATVLTSTLVPVALAGASTVPGSPEGVHASEVAGIAQVHWTRPASNGNATITHYVVTAHPSNATCVTKTTSCLWSRLTPGGSYTFTVVADNAAGASAPSAPSNRFRVPSVKASFLSAVTALNVALSADQQSINAATTTSKLTADLKKYKATYAAFTSALRHDAWPSIARNNIVALENDVTSLANDTVNAYLASASTAAELFDTLQVDNNKEIEVDAKVRGELGLAELITGPITAATPITPVYIGNPQTVHDFSGDALPVTVTQVIDPATAGTGSGLADAGFRFVAVVMNLSDPGGGEIEGDANFSTTVLGSDDQTYTADFGTASECTNFVYGFFDLLGDDSSSGCVLFQLPATVTVQAVFFSLAPGYLDTVEWSV